MDVILLERIESLGQMGDVVKVKPGYARNYLLPQHKAMRATKENREYFEKQRLAQRRRGGSQQPSERDVGLVDGHGVKEHVEAEHAPHAHRVTRREVGDGVANRRDPPCQ